MKSKLLVLSISALLGISLLTGCGPTQSSSTPSETPSSDVTPTETPTETQTEVPSTSETLPELTIALTAAKKEIGIAEDLELLVTVENNTENKAISVTSSDESIVTIVTKESKTYAHGVKAGAVTLTATVGEKSATLALTVKQTPVVEGSKAIKHLQDTIAKAIENESKTLVSGTYHEVNKNVTNDTVTQDDTSTFEVYADKKVEATTNKTAGYTKGSTHTYFGRNDKEVIVYQTETKNEVTSESVRTKTKEIIVEGESDYTHLSSSDADKYLSLVDLSASANLNNAGIISNFKKNTLDRAKLLTTEDLASLAKLERLTETTYKLVSSGYTGYKYEDVEITYTVDSTGLTGFEYVLTSYLKVTDPKTEEVSRGDKSQIYTISATLVNGERRNAPAEFINFDTLYYTDYTPVLAEYEDSEALTEAGVGTSLSVRGENAAPATASSRIDAITIKSISPADVAEISEDKQTLTLLAACDALTVTTTSKKGIEKTLTLKITQPVVNEIWLDEFDGSNLAINTEHELYFNVDPYESTDAVLESLEVVVTTDGTCDAEAYLNDYNNWALFATVAGTATLKVSSPYYLDEEGNRIVVETALTFVEGSAETEITPESLAASICNGGTWMDAMGSESNAFLFTQLPYQVGTATFRFQILLGELMATGEAEIWYNQDDMMYEIGISLDAEGCTLPLLNIFLGSDDMGQVVPQSLTLEYGDAEASEYLMLIQITE